MKTCFLIVLALLAVRCSGGGSTNPVVNEMPGAEKPDSIIAATEPENESAIPAWEGKWERLSRNNNGTLEIDKVDVSSFSFRLFAMNGGHTGDLDGIAKIKGNKAVYKLKGGGLNCTLEFTLAKDQIEIEQLTEDCGAGMAVEYSGTYVNAKLGKKIPEETMLSLGILQSPQQEAIFRKLVGSKYEAFLNTTQLVSDVENLDSIPLTGFASGVRGLFTSMENIVLYNSRNELWCAVIDNDKVYYFTNSKLFRKSLPKTVEQWRENFKELEVVYSR